MPSPPLMYMQKMMRVSSGDQWGSNAKYRSVPVWSLIVVSPVPSGYTTNNRPSCISEMIFSPSGDHFGRGDLVWKRESIRRELPETGAVGVFKEHSNLLRAEGLMEDF